MRAREEDADARPSTFTQVKRRDQLIECVIDAIVDLGFQRASVAEVARRARVSKGVVTYHFPAKDDLIYAAVADIFDSIKEWLEAALRDTPSERFLSGYITAWVDYYRTHRRNMLAIREIWANFRDHSGAKRFGPDTVEQELRVVEHLLDDGQASGHLGVFSTRVMAVTVKAALDALLNQLVVDPELELDAYGAELVALFERATRPDP